MNYAVQNFTDAVAGIFKYFHCPNEYLLKPLTHMRWRIREDEGISFLTYWSEEGSETSLIIARKNGKILLYRTKEHTMVIAIDCVKIGFIFENGNESKL